MDTDDVGAADPVCPHCGQGSIRCFPCKMICDDCQHTEAVAHEPGEDKDAFTARLDEMAARWHTTSERMRTGQDYDPYDDPDWTA